MNKSKVKRSLITIGILVGAGIAEVMIQDWLNEGEICRREGITRKDLKQIRKLYKEGKIRYEEIRDDDMVIRVMPGPEEDYFYKNHIARGEISIRLGSIWGWDYNEYCFSDKDAYEETLKIMQEYHDSLSEG